MGGWQSTATNPNPAEKGYYDVRKERNNNKDDTIIIPVDFSKHADDAFECGYSIWCCLLQCSTYVRKSFQWSLNQLFRHAFIFVGFILCIYYGKQRRMCWGDIDFHLLNFMWICGLFSKLASRFQVRAWYAFIFDTSCLLVVYHYYPFFDALVSRLVSAN